MDLVSKDIHDAIEELETLIEKDSKKNCEECYKETNKVLSLVEQREADAKHTIIKLTRELEELQNRSCSGCKHREMTEGGYYCQLVHHKIYVECDFCCNRFEEKGEQMGSKIDSKTLLSYCILNEYMPYLGSQRKRDLLPQEEQLRKIALAQQKREKKALKKGSK